MAKFASRGFDPILKFEGGGIPSSFGPQPQFVDLKKVAAATVTKGFSTWNGKITGGTVQPSGTRADPAGGGGDIGGVFAAQIEALNTAAQLQADGHVVTTKALQLTIDDLEKEKTTTKKAIRGNETLLAKRLKTIDAQKADIAALVKADAAAKAQAIKDLAALEKKKKDASVAAKKINVANNKKIGTLNGTILNNQKTIDKLRADITGKNDLVSLKIKTIDELIIARDKANENQATTAEQLKQKKTDLADANKASAKVKKIIQDELKAEQKKLGQANATVRKITDQRDAHNKALGINKTIIKNLNKKIVNRDGTIKSINKAKADQAAKIKLFQKEIAAYETALVTSGEEFYQQASEVEGLTVDVLLGQEKQEKLTDERDKVISERNQLMLDIEAMMAELFGHTQNINTLEASVVDWKQKQQAELLAKQQAVAKSKNELGILNDKNKALAKDVQTAQKAHTDSVAQLNKIILQTEQDSKAVGNLNDEQQKLLDKIGLLEIEKNDATQKVQQVIADAQDESNTNTQIIEEQTTQINVLEQQIIIDTDNNSRRIEEIIKEITLKTNEEKQKEIALLQEANETLREDYIIRVQEIIDEYEYNVIENPMDYPTPMPGPDIIVPRIDPGTIPPPGPARPVHIPTTPDVPANDVIPIIPPQTLPLPGTGIIPDLIPSPPGVETLFPSDDDILIPLPPLPFVPGSEPEPIDPDIVIVEQPWQGAVFPFALILGMLALETF